MKILLLFPMADGQTGPAIKYAFRCLGHDVWSVDAKLDWQDSYNVSLRVEPDLVFCSRTELLTNEVRKIKRVFSNATVCMWNVDTRTNIDDWRHLFPLIDICDYHFVPDSETISQWRKLTPNTFWLPQGLQDEIYNRPERITEEDRKKYSCDVCWAGDIEGVHGFRKSFLEAIKQTGVKFKQWGCRGNSRIYNEEHNKMVALSKINLGCSGWPENKKYTSVRDYKIMGAGGFLLELYREGLYGIFPSNTIDSYRDVNELKKKIEYWLNCDEERKILAEVGCRWVHENATYTHRIRMALEYMEGKS